MSLSLQVSEIFEIFGRNSLLFFEGMLAPTFGSSIYWRMKLLRKFKKNVDNQYLYLQDSCNSFSYVTSLGSFKRKI